MSDFSQLLSCHIHSKDIKTYALAQYCGLDRSNMYKMETVFTGAGLKDMQIYAAFPCRTKGNGTGL